MHSMIDSAFRHLAKYMMGMTDEDHLCAAATNLLMAMWTEENVPEVQDIPARKEAAKTARVVENTSPYNNLEVCNCYMRDGYVDGDGPRCMGTKEVEHCSCGGDKTRCDFYQYGKE